MRVSVVIPTRGRPEFVRRAARSVAQQSHPAHEVIVVLDGPEPSTRRLLEEGGAKLRVIELPEPGGANAARNAGVACATGELIAFLDDDDQWAPRKLERQCAALEALGPGQWIVSTRYELSAGRESVVFPPHPPRGDQALAEYLFVHDSISGCTGTLSTSTLLASRALLERVPFDPALRRHQDVEWLLRVSGEADARVFMVWETLVSIDAGTHPRISQRPDWRHALEFAERRRELFTPRAYSSFLLTQVTRQAWEQGELRAQPKILRAALTQGAPTVSDLAWYFARALLPPAVKQTGRKGLDRALAGLRALGPPAKPPPPSRPRPPAPTAP